MISYELAKQLKDEGFPQSAYCYHCGSERRENPALTEEYKRKLEPHGRVYYPTVEELVRALGDELYSTINRANGMGDGWEVRGEHDRINAPTLVEALVMLWLALNKID